MEFHCLHRPGPPSFVRLANVVFAGHQVAHEHVGAVLGNLDLGIRNER
jgi:hypothetical protein